LPRCFRRVHDQVICPPTLSEICFFCRLKFPLTRAVLVLPPVTQGGSVWGASWIWEAIAHEIPSGTWLVTLICSPSPFVSTTDSPSRFSLYSPLLCPLLCNINTLWWYIMHCLPVFPP
jgi:hypothetical protein